MERRPTVYTIGHGSRSKEAFAGLLRQHGVQVVVDVRRWPTSKTEHFKREQLERWLRQLGFEYVWMGDKLGGYRKGGYKAYSETEEFVEGIKTLTRLADEKRVCVMCLEVGPAGCHRRFIAARLRQLGYDVVHIISEKKSVREFAVGRGEAELPST